MEPVGEMFLLGILKANLSIFAGYGVGKDIKFTDFLPSKNISPTGSTWFHLVQVEFYFFLKFLRSKVFNFLDLQVLAKKP